MLKVRILVGLAGSPFQPGEEPTLPDDVGRQLLAEGRAELLTPESARPRKPTRE